MEGIKDGVLRVPFPSYNMPGIGRKRRKRRKAKQRVHKRRRQATDTAADIQSKKEEKAKKRKLHDFMLEEICEAVLRIEANDDALVVDDVVADTVVVPTIEDAVHSRLPEGTPQEPLTSEIVTVSRAEKRKAVEAENQVEVAAPVKEESRYSANAIASIDAHTLCGCVGVCGCVQASLCLSVCTCLVYFFFIKLSCAHFLGGRLNDSDAALTARSLPPKGASRCMSSLPAILTHSGSA